MIIASGYERGCNMNTKDLTDILRVEGINAKGFGFVPKLVMQDVRLTPEAKCIYSYFCSYAGAGNQAFPSVSLILYHLCMSESRYYRHFKLLKKYGYIKTEQSKSEKNKFSKTIYTLVTNPVPSTQNEGTENSPSTHFESTENESTQIEGTQNEGYNNNSLNNSIIKNKPVKKNNQSINRVLSGTENKHPSKNDGLIEKYSMEYIREMLETDGYATDRQGNLYEELTNLVFDVVNSDSKTIKVNGTLLPTEVVRSRFLKLTPGNLLYVIEVFKKQTTKVNNIRQYLITALYNSFSTLDSYYTNAVNHDLYGA